MIGLHRMSAAECMVIHREATIDVEFQ